MQALESDLRRMLALWLEVPERFFAGDIRRCAAHLGYNEVLAQHLVKSTQAARARGERSGMDVLCRWDLAFSEQGWRIHEINIGSNTGAMGMTMLGNIYRELIQRTPTEVSPACLKEHAWETSGPLADVIARRVAELPEGECLAIAEDDSCFADLESSLTSMRSLFGQATGRPVVAVRSSALKAVPGGLAVDGLKVGAIYSYFTIEDVIARPEVYGPIMEAIYAGQVRHLMGFQYIPFGNKLTMTVLSEAAASGALSGPELRLVEKYIPWSRRLTAETREQALQGQQTLVIKPADCYGGIGVMCGWELTPEAWKAEIDRILAAQEPYMLQEQALSTHASLGFVYTDGQIAHARVRPVVGLYMVGGKLAGGLCRASYKDIGVLNVKNGAAIGTVMLRD
jgi:hypothetical protein